MMFDNGLEFAQHYRIKQQFDIDTFFTRLYSSREKGTVENRIGLLRRWLPKGESMDHYTEQQIQGVEGTIKNRGVRELEYFCPLEKIKSTCDFLSAKLFIPSEKEPPKLLFEG